MTRAINTFSVCKSQDKWVLRLPWPTLGVGFLSPTQERPECNSCQKAATACARNTLLRSSNCQEIRTHNSHRRLWLRLRHSRQKGNSMHLSQRDLHSDSYQLCDLGQALHLPWASVSLIWEDKHQRVPNAYYRIGLIAGAQCPGVIIINNLWRVQWSKTNLEILQ